jgi:N-acetylglucosamine malate deacetylase 1
VLEVGCMNIIAVGAHPDDVELTAGGTLLRYAGETARGHGLTICTVSDGARGVTSDSDPAEIVANRFQEASAAAEYLGAEYINLGFPDGELTDSAETRQEVTRVLRHKEAEVVLAPPPDDYNPDHNAVSDAVAAACLWASAPGFTDEGQLLERTPALYYCDAIGGLGSSHPTHYVDIGDVFDEKLALLRFHRSQTALSSEQFGGDLIEIATATNRFRGLQVGVAYAEAFRPALMWPRLAPGWLLPS